VITYQSLIYYNQKIKTIKGEKTMASLKKTLIATASAVVLATTTFASLPAFATGATYALTVAGSAPATAGTSEASAIALPVPTDNSVDTVDTLDFALTGITAGETVSVTATDATLIAAGTTGTITASTGAAVLTIATGTGTTAGFKVYTKTTKVGKVVVTVGAATAVTYYVKGTAGALNSITLTAPTAALGTTAKVTATGTDVFGNVVSGATVALQVISGTATNTYSLTTATDGTAVKDLTGLSVDTYDLIATATVAAQVTGLTKPVGFVKGQLKVVDLSALAATKDAELAVATATIADLKAQLVALKAAEIAKYNKLAARWNKANPNKKIALRK
jgi:hypothetical protein